MRNPIRVKTDLASDIVVRASVAPLAKKPALHVPAEDCATQAYRDHNRSTIAGLQYSGWRHATTVLIACVCAILALLYGAPQASLLQWSGVVLATLGVANFVEYWTHRGPMHRPTRLLRPMFERHARRHHRYFARGRMALSDHRDLHAVLFPPVLFLFFAAIATALSTLIALTLSTSAALVFAVTCVVYYLSYEILHLFYHLPGTERVPVLGYLARLHRIHHHSRGQRLSNFNLVFPLCDWVFGTLDDHPATESCRRRG